MFSLKKKGKKKTITCTFAKHCSFPATKIRPAMSTTMVIKKEGRQDLDEKKWKYHLGHNEGIVGMVVDLERAM